MLKEIIPAIIPDNIKEIQLLKDALDIFLDYLVENSDISENIKNVFDQKKVPIYEEFIKIYLDNIYKILSNPVHNEKLYNKLKHLYSLFGENIDDVDLSVDLIKLLKEDYFLTQNIYKSSKGTSKAMQYIYDIIIRTGIQKDFLDDNTGDFKYYENGYLFEYNIEGTMIAEIYEHFVKPLTHPVGWAYFYQQVFYLNFIDYFDLEFIYTLKAFEVKCMNGPSFSKDDYMFNIDHNGNWLVTNYGKVTANYDSENKMISGLAHGRNIETDIVSIEVDNKTFTTNIINGHYEIQYEVADVTTLKASVQGKDGTIYSSDDEVKPENQNDNIESIIVDFIGANKTKRTDVYFKSGEHLVSIEDTRDIKLYSFDGSIIRDYDDSYGNCGLFLRYDVEVKTTVKDTIAFEWRMPLASTTGKINSVGSGNVFIGAFKADEFLVNKNVPVTYKSFIGEYDDPIKAIKEYESFDTSDLYFESFNFDADSRNNYIGEFSNYDGTAHIGTFSLSSPDYYNKRLLGGATAIDDFEMHQILTKEPLVNFNFQENLKEEHYFNERNLFFDNFNFDDDYISETFEIKAIKM